MMRQVQELTSRYCEDHFRVTRCSTSRDFKEIVALGLAVQIGAGRSTRYVLTGNS